MASFYSELEGAARHGQVVGVDGATAAEGHGRGWGTVQQVIADVKVAAGQREKDWGGRARVRVRQIGAGVVDDGDGDRALRVKRSCLGGSWRPGECVCERRERGEVRSDEARRRSGVRAGGVQADPGVSGRHGHDLGWGVQGTKMVRQGTGMISAVTGVY